MRALINDLLRGGIACCVLLAGLLMSGWQRLRLRRFAQNQENLKRKYGLRADTPVVSYGPEVERCIEAVAARVGRNARFAFTSGSAGTPKRILYTRQRLRALKFVFSEMFARACWAFKIKRTSLYVFSSFEPDKTLTSLILDENDLPNYLSTLQAPYRVQRHSAMRALVAKYGSTAVRLWILAITNPGVIYSTNPSTISTFFDELTSHWQHNSKLVRDWCHNSTQFDSAVHKIARRLDSRGSAQRLRAIAASEAPLAVDVWAPSLQAYICWNGGYVKPFLEQLQKYLPAPRYRLIPMYSMSTETVETLSYFQDNDVFFIPAAAGVVYEFIDEAGPEQLLRPLQLEPEKMYAMVVSNGYGLRRYHMGDLFLCKRKVDGLPDLAFLRRCGLEHSFTGEKLTAEQLGIVFAQLREQYPQLILHKYLTCMPSFPTGGLPHYKVLLIGERNGDSDLELLAARCDELLRETNCEYRSKRAHGLLGAVRFVPIGVREFAERFSLDGSWESQFKFLPLLLPGAR